MANQIFNFVRQMTGGLLKDQQKKQKKTPVKNKPTALEIAKDQKNVDMVKEAKEGISLPVRPPRPQNPTETLINKVMQTNKVSRKKAINYITGTEYRVNTRTGSLTSAAPGKREV